MRLGWRDWRYWGAFAFTTVCMFAGVLLIPDDVKLPGIVWPFGLIGVFWVAYLALVFTFRRKQPDGSAEGR